MQLPELVEILEVGPRDGLQNEATTVPTPLKIELIEALASAGIRRFEATSFVSPKWIPNLADAEDVLAGLSERPGVVYGGLIPNERGYERARAAGAAEAVLIVSATEGHCRANLNRSVDEQLDTFAPVAERGRLDGVHVRANVSTAFGCPFDGRPETSRVMHAVHRIAEAGITEITLSDTIGVANPRQVHEVFSAVREAHPDVKLGAHFHDTRGLALANIVAALQTGVQVLDSSIGGLGGCPYAPGASGNVSTEDVVFMLEEMGISTGVSLEGLFAAAEVARRAVGHPLRSRIGRGLVAASAAR